MSKSSTSKAAKSNEIDEQNQPTTVALYDIDDVAPHHCGYCDSNGNISIGMSSDSMQIEDYQLLINRGWRRSGTYIYKPKMDQTCCPLYPIRCNALKFELRKSQKNTLKSARKYLEKDEKKKSNNKSDTNTNDNKTNETSKSLVFSTDCFLNKQNKSGTTHAKKVIAYFLDKNVKFSDNKNLTPNEILKIPKLKAKHRRLFNKLNKLKEKNLINDFSDIQNCLKRKLQKPDNGSIESYLKLRDNQNVKNKLEIKLVRSWPPNEDFQKTLQEEHDLYTKYQMTIHKDKRSECQMSQFQRFLCTSPLMHLSYDGPLKKLQEFEIQNRKDIDHDIIGDISALGYGSFHQQYRLNGKIIAVGVIDILNDCVSSVYFFYDPEYQFLNMGTYSALREIAFVRQLSKLDPNIKWYYLGYYVNNCQKMRYKAFFYPSYLACPEVYSWHPIEFCIPLLNQNKYSRFAPSGSNDLVNQLETKDLDENESIENVKIRVKFQGSDTKIFKFNEFCNFLNQNFVPSFTHLIKGYCKLFGKRVSNRILIKF